MSSELLNIAAEILEKTAAYVDALEAEQVAAGQAERTKLAEAFRTRYSEVTGENISDELIAKLASSDTDLISMFDKLAGSAQAPESMGGPGNVRDDSAAPRTKKEAAVVADDRFLAWLQS